MKNLRYILFVSIVFAACTSSETEEQKAMAVKDSAIHKESRLKDSNILAYIRSLNEIQENLQLIKMKEKIISLVQPGELNSMTGNMVGEIKAMDELIVKNDREIYSLEKKLNGSDKETKELKRLVMNFEQDLNGSDSTINILEAKLAKANDSIKLIVRQFNDSMVVRDRQRMEIAVIKDLGNSIYYIAGTYKELKDRGVVIKEGGVSGVGGNIILKQDFNTSYFSSGLKPDLHEIHLDGKFSKLVTSHPADTYKVAGDNKKDIFFITDPAFFWSQSKYLVIILQTPEVQGSIAPPQ